MHAETMTMPISPTLPDASPHVRATAAAVAGLALASGLTALGAAASFDRVATPELALTGLSLGPSIWLRAALLTGPSMLVVAAVRGDALRASGVLEALALGVARGGRLAAGFAPPLALFALTTDLTPLVGLAVVAWCGLETVTATGRALLAREASPGTVAVWQLASLLVGLRLVVDGTVELARVVFTP